MKSQQKHSQYRVTFSFAAGSAVGIGALAVLVTLLNYTRVSVAPFAPTEVALLCAGTAGAATALWLLRRQQ
jgi:hypothetical protein